ncbi:DUF6197 family protein [Streptomyces aureocirculatus]|uniref:DUF6197 family protein n=1 Tax=Streptomyces aureocirculatus TaxID=67275 RepID=UPI0004C56FE5|nr:hypothetical protein [Streptomyces aureocirculatus]
MTDRPTGLDAALRNAADLGETQWTPDPNGPGICSLLALAAPSDGRRPDETDLWDAVVTHLDEELTVTWEQCPGRTRGDVAAMLRAAAASSA